jgi:cytochrome P450
MTPVTPAVGPFAILAEPTTLDNPYPAFERIRALGHVAPAGDGQWVVGTWDGVDAVLNDPRFSGDPRKAKAELAPAQDVLNRLGFEMMILKDAPDHDRLRLLVNKAFRPHSVRHMQDTIQGVVDDLVDAVIDRGEMDLIEDLAFPLPVRVICAMLGVPMADADRLRGVSDRLSKMLDPTKVDVPEYRSAASEAAGEFVEYFEGLAKRRREAPEDDLISALVHAEDEGDRLSHDELLANLMLLIVAGHETTANLIGNSFRAFGLFPEQWQRIVDDPDIAENAVEECLRFDGPAQMRTRIASEDVELLGQRVGKGELLIVIIASANHDPSHFDAPDELDVGRSIDKVFAHGDGLHYCLGAALSRAETQTVFRTLATRLRDIEPAADIASLPRHDSLAIRGILTLPLTFSAR